MAVTMEDVARRANVSLATVSRVLNRPHMVNPATRDVVIEAIKDLGYSLNPLARGLRTRQTLGFAAVVSHITDPLEAAILEQLADVAMQHRYSLQVYVTQGSPERAMHYAQQLIYQKRVDGIFWMDAAAMLDDIDVADTPLILVNSVSQRAFRINYDYETITYIATKHLIEMGHEQIILLRQEGDPFYKARWAGYWKAISENKIPHQDSVYAGDWKSLPVPSAIIVPNDHIAADLYRYARANALRIPRDFSIVGFGNVPFVRYLSPALTTINPSNTQLAKLAFEVLTNLDTITESETMVSDYELIVRDSVAHR
jgi:LacI family transcriptional regulator